MRQTCDDIPMGARHVRQGANAMEMRRMKAGEIVTKVGLALGFTQREMGETFGASRRTCTRWVAGHSNPTAEQLGQMARLVYPVDPALATSIAAQLNQSLESLGIVRPAPGPSGPPPRVISSASLAEVVVCAAAHAMDVSPRAVRPSLLAAFTQARALGLTIDELIAALTPPSPTA